MSHCGKHLEVFHGGGSSASRGL
ncbi:MAG: hypothetical protein RLZZ501_848, partial [Pseudomonadota bacterium]